MLSCIFALLVFLQTYSFEGTKEGQVDVNDEDGSAGISSKPKFTIALWSICICFVVNQISIIMV